MQWPYGLKKQFIPLLTRPQGSQGVKKPDFFLQIKLFRFCAKIDPKLKKL